MVKKLRNVERTADNVIVREITFRLRYRNFSELSNYGLDVLDQYRYGEITFDQAHNELINLGFNLHENNVIVDY